MQQWLATGEHQVPAGVGWLSAREARHLRTIRFTKRRTEFLLRRHAGKRAVAEVLGLGTTDPELAGVEILNRPTGAPYVEVAGRPGGLDLSLTDRAGWGVCLVGEPGSMAAGTVGVDLEIVEPRSPGFVADFLTPTEQAWVNGRPAGTDRDAAANLVWSAKEAALKVMRVGLRADTRSVEVRIHHAAHADQADPAGHAGRTDGWQPMEVAHLASGQLFPGWWRRDGVFLLTLALLEPGDPPRQLPGSANLHGAAPIHSWVGSPLVAPDR